MAETWNATYEAKPAGDTQAATLDTVIQTLKKEIRKRMDTIVTNWATDPDTPVDLIIADALLHAGEYTRLYNMDLNAEGPSGTYNGINDTVIRVKEAITNHPTSGTVYIDGDSYAYSSLTVGDKEFNLDSGLTQDYAENDTVSVKQLIYGVKEFEDIILDKNGHEVLAMQMETIEETTGYTVAAAADQSISVTGFSWNPTAVLAVQVVYGSVDNQERWCISYPGTVVSTSYVVINSVACTTTEVTVGIRNGSAATIYVEQVIVTAVRAP